MERDLDPLGGIPNEVLENDPPLHPGASEGDGLDDQGDLQDSGPEDLDLEDQPEPAPRPDAGGKSERARQRITAIQEQARLEQARAVALERELAALREQQALQQRQFQEQVIRRREEEEIASLPFEQQVEYRLRKSEQEHQAAMQRMQLQQHIMNDQSAYFAKAAADPDMRRMQQQVDQMFYERLNAGQYLPREAIFTYLYGQEQLSKRAATKTRVTTPGVQRQRVAAPNGGRNDVAPARSRGGGKAETLEQREARLSSIRF